MTQVSTQVCMACSGEVGWGMALAFVQSAQYIASLRGESQGLA